ncbi:MAG: ATP synthase delta/epsilon chain alpha-helix domain-containing protein, partial [Patescibacteria group bacterium]
IITVLSDTATLESDITIARAEEAKQKAEKDMEQKTDRRSFIMAEASLRKALIELKIARRRGTPTSFG